MICLYCDQKAGVGSKVVKEKEETLSKNDQKMQERLKISEAKSLLKRSSSPVGRASFDTTQAWKIVEGLHSVLVFNLPTEKCRRLHVCTLADHHWNLQSFYCRGSAGSAGSAGIKKRILPNLSKPFVSAQTNGMWLCGYAAKQVKTRR